MSRRQDAIGRIHAAAGSHVVLIYRCPGEPDVELIASGNETESKTLCACAMSILLARPVGGEGDGPEVAAPIPDNFG